MTAKREGKAKPKKDERPKLKKETVKDLDTKRGADQVKGGGGPRESLGSADCSL